MDGLGSLIIINFEGTLLVPSTVKEKVVQCIMK